MDKKDNKEVTTINELAILINKGFQGQQDYMDKKFQAIDERFKKVDERFDRVDEEIARMDRKHDDEIKYHRERLRNVENTLEIE